jgi:hypothetical protein
VERTPEVIQKIFEAKDLRRKRLSKLSFKKKIEILIQMQKMASGVKRKKRKPDQIIWDVEIAK